MQEFYRNLLRCGYFMPAETAPCCTIDFFDWTVRKLIWVPLQNQVHPICIASPPPAKVLKASLIDLLKQQIDDHCKLKLAEYLEGHDANASWYLSLIYVLQPDHQYFQCNYNYRASDRQEE